MILVFLISKTNIKKWTEPLLPLSFISPLFPHQIRGANEPFYFITTHSFLQPLPTPTQLDLCQATLFLLMILPLEDLS